MKNNENIFDLKDFIYHNSNELQRLSYVKQEALKQISRCRFQIEGEKCIVNIIWEGIKMKLVVTNDISVYDFTQQLWTVSPREMSVNFMLEKLYQFKGDLLNVLEQYKNKYLKSASDFRGEIWINQRIIAGNAQFTGIAAGRGVGFTTGLLLLREGLGMRETPIRPHSWH